MDLSHAGHIFHRKAKGVCGYFFLALSQSLLLPTSPLGTNTTSEQHFPADLCSKACTQVWLLGTETENWMHFKLTNICVYILKNISSTMGTLSQDLIFTETNILFY